MNGLERFRQIKVKRELLLAVAAAPGLTLLALIVALVFPAYTLALYLVLALGVIAQMVLVVMLFYSTLLPMDLAMREIEADADTAHLSPSLFSVVREVLAHYRDTKDREYASLLLQKQAEIDALQSQINPHFLNNTLDSIRGLAMEEHAAQTCEMVGSLSRFLRYTISQKHNMISLNEELDSVKSYMTIQRYRFADRFSLSMTISPGDEHILRYRIPKLTLQPLIENAIYHGLDSIAAGGKITIFCELTQSRLIIDVTDNGVGMDCLTLEKINKKLHESTVPSEEPREIGHGSGVALYNVNARIKLVYGERYGLTMYSIHGQGTKAQIILPLKESMYEM